MAAGLPRPRVAEAEPGGDPGRDVRRPVDRGAGGDHDVVDLGDVQAGVRDRLVGGAPGHLVDLLVRGRDPALADADPALDPLVVGLDHGRELVVGEHPFRLVVAERDNSGSGHQVSCGHRRTPVLHTEPGGGAPSVRSRTSGW